MIAERDALAAARELLPAWVVWGRVVAPPILVLLTQACLGTWAMLLLEERAGPQSGVHWSERARRIANFSAPIRTIYWTLVAPAFFVPVLLASEIDPAPAGLIVFTTFVLSMILGSLMARSAWRRLQGVEVPARAWRRARLTGLLTSGVPLLTVLACLLLVGSHPGRAGVLLLCFASALILLFSRGLGWHLLKPLGLVEPVDVRPLLGDSAEGASFFLFDSPAVSAYALPSLRTVIFSRRAREVLSDPELAAVLHHELGHIGEHRRVRVLRRLPVLLLLTLIWLKPLAGLFTPQVAICIVILGFLLAALAGRRSTKLEAAADAIACSRIEDPLVYARALEKLGESNLSPAVTERETTHPHLYDRMVAAGMQPDFPRPSPPRTGQPWWILLCVVVCIELGTVDSWTRPARVPHQEHAVLRALALGGWTSAHLFTIAQLCEERGDRAAAERFRAAAFEITRSQPQEETGSVR